MDEHFRRLERLAAQGDYEARELLLNHAARIGLIPSKTQLHSMHYGWAVGNTNDPNPNAAAEFILETWKTLLQELGERAYRWRQSFSNVAEPGPSAWHAHDVFDDNERDYENFGIELQNLSKGFVDPNSVYEFLGPLHEYINGYLASTVDLSGLGNIPLDLEVERGDFGYSHPTDVSASYRSPQGIFLKFSISSGIDLHGGFIPLADLEWNTWGEDSLALFNNLPSSLCQLPPLWESWGAGAYPD